MSLKLGTSGGNKDAAQLYVGTAGGNKLVAQGYIGTPDGNKLFHAANDMVVTIDPASDIWLPVDFENPGVGGYYSQLPFTANVTGGVAPYTYNWTADYCTPIDPAVSSTSFYSDDGAAESNINCTVTDAFGNVATATVPSTIG